MKLIGVTGGVGSGKSEILHHMETHYNCRILFTDDAARALEAPGGAIYDRLVRLLDQYPAAEQFHERNAGSVPSPESPSGGLVSESSCSSKKSSPESISDHADFFSESSCARTVPPITLPDGRINNPEMARRIFSQPALLEKVNQLVHPAVKDYVLEAYEQEKRAGRYDFFVVEAALLIECGYGKDVDAMWYIYCDEQERRRRLRASRGYSDEKIDDILKNQLSEKKFRENADLVIDNSGALEDACRQVDRALAACGFSQIS